MSYIGQAPSTIVSENTFDEFNFTATSNQTTFSGVDSDGKTLVYNPGNLEVFLNGVRLEEADFTATNGTSVVLSTGATTGDVMSVKSFTVFEVSDTVSKASGGAFGGNISVTGTVTATSYSGDGSSLSGISTDLVGDITPQLGGNLDLNSKNITGTGNIDITGVITDPAIDMGTNKKIRFTGAIGEIGSVPGFQATNDANDGLRSMGLRGTTLRFATGDDERLRIEDNAVGIGTESPSTTDSGYNKGALHVHNASGSGAQVRWTNSTTGTGTSDGFMISKWSDKNTYMTNFDDGAKTVFTQSNSSGALVADTMVLDGNGNIGIGISPATSAGVNYARLVIDADSSTYPKSLEINATNSAGPNFAISSYSDANGSYYLMGANLSYQTNGNFAWETNGEHMSGVVLDSRSGHGVTFVDSYYDGSAYVPAEIGKANTSSDGRADITVDATGLAGDGGVNANAFFNAKAKGVYYAGLDIKSNSGHVGGWIGHWNGSSTARNLQARVGGTGINASDYLAIKVDYLGRVTTPNVPSCSVYNCGFGSSATSWSSAGSGSANGGLVGVAHHNNGNHYSTSTGYFTAPVAGYYLCNLNVYGKKDNNHGDNAGYWWGYFQKNGGYYAGNYIMEAYYNSGDYDQGASISSIIYLAGNDTVRPYCGSYIHGISVYGPNTSFSCHLLG